MKRLREVDLDQDAEGLRAAVEREFRRTDWLLLGLVALCVVVWGVVGFVAAALLSGERLLPW